MVRGVLLRAGKLYLERTVHFYPLELSREKPTQAACNPNARAPELKPRGTVTVARQRIVPVAVNERKLSELFNVNALYRSSSGGDPCNQMLITRVK